MAISTEPARTWAVPTLALALALVLTSGCVEGVNELPRVDPYLPPPSEVYRPAAVAPGAPTRAGRALKPRPQVKRFDPASLKLDPG